MRKVTNKLLTLMLSFAMVFTGIVWMGAGEAYAAEGDSIFKVLVQDADGNPLEGVDLALSDPEELSSDLDFGPTDADGLAEFDTSSEGQDFLSVDNYGDDVYYLLKAGEGYTYPETKVVFGGEEDEYYVISAGGENYNGGPFVFTVEAEAAETVDYVDMQKNHNDDWKLLGIPYSEITADDYILDVRQSDRWTAGHLAGSTNVDVTVSNYLENGYVADGSALAADLDAAYAAAGDKRIVIVCNGGQTLAARALQYFNKTNYGGAGVDFSKVTFLQGGATAIPAEDLVAVVDYVDMQKNHNSDWTQLGIPYSEITADDYILDVRQSDRWTAGHLAWSTNVDVTVSDYLDNGYVADGSALASDLDAAYAAAGDKRIVIVCNGGQTLAARALQYYNKTNFDNYGVDFSKVTFLQGGATAIPAEDLVAVVDYVDMQKNHNDDWKLLGIPYSEITADDYILDVRQSDRWTAGHLAWSTNVDVTVADYLDNGYVAEGSALAADLDAAYEAAGDKRIVIVCNGGQTLAARALQYYNARFYGADGVKFSEVTFLQGGATAIPAEDLVTSVDYVDMQKNHNDDWTQLGVPYSEIKSDDFFLDVRQAARFEAGHIAGSMNVDVTVADYLDNGYVAEGSALAADLDAAYEAAGDKRIVIVCNGGQTLAARALQYYNAKFYGADGVKLNKITFLQGGANNNFDATKVIPRTLGDEKARTMTVSIDMTKYEAGKVVKVWVPVPQTEDYQEISNESFEAKTAAVAEFRTEDVNGNKMLYLEWDASADPAGRKATLTFDAKRSEAGHPELIGFTGSFDVYPDSVQNYITEESFYVKVNNETVQRYAAIAAGGKTDTLSKARSIYEWVIANLERIDDGEVLNGREFEVEGCGYGSTVKILTDLDEVGRAGGHCTDINSVFVALCRANGIPAREMFGIRMNDNATGGQHCWAEFYLPGTGWVYADPADVLKNIKPGKNLDKSEWDAARATQECKNFTAYWWGTVEANRIVLSRGRDVIFNPAQSWGGCNTFGYPAAEVDGVRLADFTNAGEFVYTISCSEINNDTPEPPAALISIAKATVTAKNATYTGKAQKPAVTVILNGKTLTKDTDYTVTYSNNVKAGTAIITVKGKGKYTGTVTGTFKINKAKQPMKIKANKPKVKAANLKNSAVTLKVGKLMSFKKKAQGTKSYKITKVSKNKSYFKINAKNGKLQIKKGLKKGTYKVTIKVTAKGNSNYKKGSKTVVVKIVVN